MLEALQDFKSALPPLEWLLQTVPHLKPRQFSIASSLSKRPGSAHITMAVVDYRTPYKRRKLGVCSSWLASIKPEAGPASDTTQSQGRVSTDMLQAQTSVAANPTHDSNGAGLGKHQSQIDTQTALTGRHLGAEAEQQAQLQHSYQSSQHAAGQHAEAAVQAEPDIRQQAATDSAACNGHCADSGQCNRPLVPVWVERGVLHLPSSNRTPMIMVGPGTGVAPFKSFLEERQQLAAGMLSPFGTLCDAWQVGPHTPDFENHLKHSGLQGLGTTDFCYHCQTN